MRRTLIVLLLGIATIAQAQGPRIMGQTHALTPWRADPTALLPESVETNVVVWYKPTYNDTTNYYDLSTRGNNGTATNAATTPTWTAGSPSYLAFDGVDDTIVLPSVPSLTNFPAGFTIVSVVSNGLGGASTVRTILQQRNNVAGGQAFHFLIYSPAAELAIWDPQNDVIYRDATSSGGVTGRWQFVAATYDNGTTTNAIRLYGDNGTRSDNTGGAAGTFNAKTLTPVQLKIGNVPEISNSKWFGGIGFLAMFNRVLSADEVLEIHRWAEKHFGDL